MQKGFAHPLLLLILLVSLVAAGFYLGLLGNKTQINQLSTPSVTKPGIIDKVTSKISTSEQKPAEEKYTNKELNFELTLPSQDLAAKEDSEGEYNKRGNGDFRKNFRGYVGYEPGKFVAAVAVLDKSSSFDSSPFTVWVFDNSDNLTVDGWYGKYWYFPFIWGDFTYDGKLKTSPQEIATVSGQTTKSGIVAYSPGSPKFIYLPVDSKMYVFRVINGQEKIGDQILASFKFLNQKSAGKNSELNGILQGQILSDSDVCVGQGNCKNPMSNIIVVMSNYKVDILDSQNDQIAYTTTTDSGGNFQAKLPAGNYYIAYKFCPDAKNIQKIEFSIIANQTINKTFSLHSGPC